ncbi:hypothetical protein CJD36_000580 [Flavipsychrobacter stenotrophus]|uniref:Uncharacterized protein n=1 Tax=Flavipsychrobacter stenotrophus TaxID=2077091 RepID=A0A2S7T022_9BACT|nr:hypothetical protein [Flavipsychrobacter stenotrophus]PQJ12288.1 hypothetical protein CJD36_000580 [Flavipsychrobacter stenotrophus]
MTYRTSVSDPFSRMVAFIVSSFIGMIIVFSLSGLMNVWLILLIYLAEMVSLSYLLMRVFSSGLIETIVMNDRLHMRWMKHYLLSKQDDKEIHFKDIEDHEYIASRISRTYALLLKDGSDVVYNQFNMYVTGKEDMEAMGRDIWDAVERYNIKNPEPEVPLGYEKKTPVYTQSPSEKRKAAWRLAGGIVGAIGIYLFVGFPILKMLFPANPVFWEFKMLAAFTGILLLFAKVFGVIYEKWQKAQGGEESEETERSANGY